MNIPPIQLGLKENWRQYTRLIINAFVGVMVGLEQTVLPELIGDGHRFTDQVFRICHFGSDGKMKNCNDKRCARG